MKYLTLVFTIALSVFAIGGCTQHQTSPTQMSSNQNSNQPVIDSTITATVKSKLISEDLFTKNDIATMNIHVETTNGVVYLTGKANRKQLKNAIRIAHNVDGVKKVVSKVKVVKHS